MKNLLKIFAFLVILTLSFSLLIGCGEKDKPEEEPEPEPEKVEEPEPTTGLNGYDLDFVSEMSDSMVSIEDIKGVKIIGEDDKAAYPDRYPKHEYTGDSFYISKTEITNKQFKTFIDNKGYSTEKFWSEDGWEWIQTEGHTEPAKFGDEAYNQDDYPVVGISYYEAEAFCKSLGLSLPTEEQWEVAARGKDGNIFPWGDEWDESKAHVNKSGPTSVGSTTSDVSPFGMLDMCGNVSEWTSSDYALYEGNDTKLPEDEETYVKGRKVVKGGNFKKANVPSYMASNRLPVDPTLRSRLIGFRVIGTKEALDKLSATE